MKEFFIALTTIILTLVVSFAITTGVVYLIFWLLGITFTMKYAAAIWLILFLLGGMFN